MSAAADAAVALIALPALAWGGWWTLLSVVALRRPGPRAPAVRPWRFAVVVPAHNEERSLPACLRSLAAAPFAQRPEIVVVADNCTDDTAAVARRHGATVIERDAPHARGKAFALELAIRRFAARERPPDVVAFVDADTVVSQRFFEAIAARLEAGARAVQVHYAAGDGDGDLARLRRLAFTLVHWSRPLGATRLGLGAGLKGNGMALRWDVASEGLGGGGITEDAAMTLELARRGVAVAFEPRATVRGYMAADYESARTQDARWEGGRMRLLPSAVVTVFCALARGRVACAAAAVEVAAPPLSALVASAAAAATLGALTGSRALPFAVGGGLALIAYVTLGLVAARAPLRDVAALRFAPRFLAHKLSVIGAVVARRTPAGWQRTERS